MNSQTSEAETRKKFRKHNPGSDDAVEEPGVVVNMSERCEE